MVHPSNSMVFFLFKELTRNVIKPESHPPRDWSLKDQDPLCKRVLSRHRLEMKFSFFRREIPSSFHGEFNYDDVDYGDMYSNRALYIIKLSEAVLDYVVFQHAYETIPYFFKRLNLYSLPAVES